MKIHVSHFPTRSLMWNKVEHRLYWYISKNWQRQSLTEVKAIVILVYSTTIENELSVICRVDGKHYETGIQKKNIRQVSTLSLLARSKKWNYIIKPNTWLVLWQFPTILHTILSQIVWYLHMSLFYRGHIKIESIFYYINIDRSDALLFDTGTKMFLNGLAKFRSRMMSRYSQVRNADACKSVWI
jgi:hypothetical protein